MRGTSMTIRLCVLVLFVTSVCQGAAAPLQRLDCVTDALNNDFCKTGSSLQNCFPQPCTGNQFSERRKRQVEAQPVVEVQAVSETSSQPTSTDALPQVEVNTTTSSSVTLASISQVVPSLPPPPHPLSAQATVVKPRSCKSGSTWEEECNTCWCLDNGMAACTVKRCEVVSPLAAGKTTSVSPSPSVTTPAPSTFVQTSSTTAVPSSAPVESPTSVSVTSSVQETSTVLPSTTSVQSPTTSVQSPTSLPVSSTTSSSGGTS